MRAVLRRIDANDDEWESLTYGVDDDFDFWVTLSVGPEFDKSVEYFQSRIRKRKCQDAIAENEFATISDRQIIVRYFDKTNLENWIDNFVKRVIASDWTACSRRLSKYFYSEYDHYR